MTDKEGAALSLADALEIVADAELAVAINSDKSGKSALKAAQDFITAKDALMAQDVSNQLQTPEGTANLYKKYAIDPALQEISATEQLNAAIREASPEYIKETKNIKDQSEAIAKLEHEMSKYQDAISKDVVYGNHSNISALLNTGLLTPALVISLITNYIKNNKSKNLKFQQS